MSATARRGQTMKKKKLKNLVKKAAGELSWPTREVAQPSGPLRIFSDPVEKSHTIFIPAAPPEDSQHPELLYLHELGHALLCERVHPFFSGAFPITGLEQRFVPAVTPLLNTAGDWFVGHWMIEFCRDVAIAELEKEYEATAAVMDKGETQSVDKFFVAVLIIAQSIKYLKVQVECSGFLDKAVQAFLAIPPEKPSIGKLEALVNSLLALGSPFRCRHVSSQGQDVLEFYRPS
jgi:hypothetical protein